MSVSCVFSRRTLKRLTNSSGKCWLHIPEERESSKSLITTRKLPNLYWGFLKSAFVGLLDHDTTLSYQIHQRIPRNLWSFPFKGSDVTSYSLYAIYFTVFINTKALDLQKLLQFPCHLCYLLCNFEDFNTLISQIISLRGWWECGIRHFVYFYALSFASF